MTPRCLAVDNQKDGEGFYLRRKPCGLVREAGENLPGWGDGEG